MNKNQRKIYGSTSKLSTISAKSYQNAVPEEIIDQTYCKCSYIIEPVVFIYNLAASILSISFSQFIYTRTLTRLLDEQSHSKQSTAFVVHSIASYFFDDPTTTTTTSAPKFMTASSSANLICNINANNRTLNDLDFIRLKAQKESADINLYRALISGIPCVLTTNILGVNCSKLGRKTLISMGLFTICIRNVILLLQAIYIQMPDYWYYISSFLDGISGGTGVLFLALHCYIADVTHTSTRSYRIMFVNYMASITSLVVSMCCGYVIKYYGFVYIYIASLMFYVFALLFTLIFVPEPLANLRKKSLFQRIKSCSLSRITNSFKVYLRREVPKIVRQTPLDKGSMQDGDDCISAKSVNEEEPLLTSEIRTRLTRVRPRNVLILLLAANFIYMFVVNGISNIFTLFLMNTPLCWDSIYISTYTVFYTIGSLVLSLFVSKFVRINDILICVLSSFSYFISLLLFGFAKSTVMIYIGGGIGFISGLESAYVRSIVTKLVTKHEVSDALTLITILDTITSVSANTIFNFLYRRMVSHMIHLLFFCVAGFIAVVVIIHTIAYRFYETKLEESVQTKQQQQQQQQPQQQSQQQQQQSQQMQQQQQMASNDLNESCNSDDDDILISKGYSKQLDRFMTTAVTTRNRLDSVSDACPSVFISSHEILNRDDIDSDE